MQRGPLGAATPSARETPRTALSAQSVAAFEPPSVSGTGDVVVMGKSVEHGGDYLSVNEYCAKSVKIVRGNSREVFSQGLLIGWTNSQPPDWLNGRSPSWSMSMKSQGNNLSDRPPPGPAAFSCSS